jgi:hypothetical protein
MYDACINNMEYFHVDENIPFCLYMHHTCFKGTKCCNPSLGFATKAKAYKGAGQE